MSPAVAAEPSATVEPIAETPKTHEEAQEGALLEMDALDMANKTPAPEKRALVSYQARYSWYNPVLGPPNCATFVNGECISRMASGERWQDWIDKSPGAVACPARFPFWTEIRYGGQTWYCLDRGSAIVGNWLDFLVSEPHDVGFGELVEVKVQWPE